MPLNEFSLRTLGPALVFIFATQAQAHDTQGSWSAHFYPAACVIESEPGVNILSESTDVSRPDLSVRITLGVLHPDEKDFFDNVPNLEAHPYVVNLQVLTGLSLRSEDVTVSSVHVVIGAETVEPIREPDSDQDDFPIGYLGGKEAVRFLAQLESGVSPIVQVTLGGGDIVEIPVLRQGFQVSNAMMRACIDQVRESGVE